MPLRENDPHPVRVPAAAVQAVCQALMPVILKHGSVAMVFGEPQITGSDWELETTVKVTFRAGVPE